MTTTTSNSLAATVAEEPSPLTPSRVRLVDIPGLATVGPRTRRLRSVLTTLGIAIGIAALVSVIGISESSKAELLSQLDALGTSRLQVQPGQSFVSGEDATLPDTAPDQIRRLPTVEHAGAVSPVEATVRRSSAIPEVETNGIATLATDAGLLDATGATMRDGRWLDPASERLPAVVLGAVTAERLGIDYADGRAVLVGDEQFTVIGILDPVPLYDAIDTAALVGYPIAERLFETSRAPSRVYVVAEQETLQMTRELLPATANPESPGEVGVTNPSDAVAARDAVDDTLTSLLLGLGAVALLVGGIGIANVMVIGVLERRTEIGVRRALGATKAHIRLQFLLEATMLGVLGGVVGVALGAAVTTGYAVARSQTLSIPPSSIVTGLGAAIVIGAAAGLSPAGRAARLAPAEAIRPA